MQNRAFLVNNINNNLFLLVKDGSYPSYFFLYLNFVLFHCVDILKQQFE